MKHLPMDKDTLLRKQVHDEVQSVFESRLKEARRGKNQAEEELELATEKFRTERRRLNGEIDRLEAELAETKEKQVRKGSAAARPAPGIDPVEVAKMRAAGEEKHNKAAREWEAEKNRLLSQHARLERALTEAIERSNNPLRSNQRITEHFEQQLKDAILDRDQIEDKFRKAEREWAEEKLRLTGKIVRVRRSEAPPKETAERASKQDSSQLKELQERLNQAESRFQLERDEFRKHIGKLELQLNQAGRMQDQLQQKIVSLEKRIQEDQVRLQGFDDAISNARKQVSKETVERIRREFDAKAQELIQQKKDLSQELNTLKEQMVSEQARMTSEIEATRKGVQVHATNATEHIRKESELKIKELMQQKMDLSQELNALKERTVSERARMTSEIEAARKGGQVHATNTTEQIRKESELKIKELMQQKMDLSQELKALKERLVVETTRMASHLEQAGNGVQARVDRSPNPSIDTEIQRIDGLLGEVTAIIDDPNSELSLVIRKNVQKAELDAYMRGILYSLGRGDAL